MILVLMFKSDAGRFANLTTAIDFLACRRRLKLYFSDLDKVRERIIAGEIIDLPHVTIKKDRRKKNEKVKNERRKIFMGDFSQIGKGIKRNAGI